MALQMHKKIPKSALLVWMKNLHSYVQHLSSGTDTVSAACACSGTGIFHKVNEMLLILWQEEFQVDETVRYEHLWSCDNAKDRQRFLMSEFPDMKAACIIYIS